MLDNITYNLYKLCRLYNSNGKSKTCTGLMGLAGEKSVCGVCRFDFDPKRPDLRCSEQITVI